jgi:hypothetical protein
MMMRSLALAVLCLCSQRLLAEGEAAALTPSAQPAASTMVLTNAVDAITYTVQAAVLTETAAAISASPTAAPLASSPTAVAEAVTTSASVEALSPTATVEATAVPTPLPTPTMVAEMKGPSNKVRLIDPSWAIALKAGAVLPLGDLATYNQAGPAGGLDLYYHVNTSFSADFFTSYSSQAYKVGGGGQPLSNIGLGVKLLYNVAEIDGVVWYAGGGMAGYYNQRTKQVLRQPVLNNTPVFDPEADSSFGLGVLGVLGGRYTGQSGWGLLLELNLVSVNLAGGTSDSLLLAQPVLGLSYEL